ncbi:enoyl-CoA hydratase/isomerase family protein [Spirosoma endbachense]|uniref:2-(1,2-epoxy-1,2-dihydrophenyl)acetyl-CoA isomerase n=1 Tax=Spirosoma endbachense TaxID=2666025 RepID=A0A6P1W328_9BACT|nr:enoyl-CoA hydratase-related protein [Spirosoma endbachense]QHV99294.1 2-(1,2-epoxy-1,2-dihydrophenyl)acetyl-CoA isomerase [Spirosoma endbachense]
MFENLLYDSTDGICRITLNRPQVYNALSPNLIHEITVAVEAAGNDDTVRVVVLTGAGDKAFCSGADLKAGFANAAASGGQLNLGESLRNGYHPMIKSMRNLAKPIIGRVNGIAAGAGCSLALACDLVICVEEAYFSQIFVNIGLMPDAGSTFFLPRLIGPQRAFELSSTGRRVYGPEAAQIGLVSRSVPATDLDQTVDDVVAYYATAPTRAIGAMKKVLNQSLYSDLDHQLEQEADNQNELGHSADSMEGIGAFLMKRKANFSGR